MRECTPMCSAPVSSARRGRNGGFTVIELMVGLLIGLLASLALTQVLVNFEGQKRTTTSGSQALADGALAMQALQRAIASAGYGFSSNRGFLGCSISAMFGGAAVPGFASVLAPVVITAGAGGAPDSLRVLASSKSSYSVPIPVAAPGYDRADAAKSQAFPVATIRSVRGPVSGVPGELMLAVVDASLPCEVFQVSATPAGNSVPRSDDAQWNPSGYPVGPYGDKSYLVNLGALVDQSFSIVNTATLQVSRFVIGTDSIPAFQARPLSSNVVNLQALYGKDTDGDGAVDVWDKVTPANNAEWGQLAAVRIALVVRSAQYDKELVTSANPLWDVGTAVTITGTQACASGGDSRCLPLKVDGLPDWQHYRYKVFDTIVPLRNMVWRS